MGDTTKERFFTGALVRVQGIYQSTCGCRTALTLMISDSLPRCLGCDETVEWHLVQEVRSSLRPGSSSQLKAVKPPLASGDK